MPFPRLRVLEFPSSNGGQVKLPRFTPQALRGLAALKSLERITPPDRINDAGMDALTTALPQLKAMYVCGNELTDAGMAMLPRLRSLEELYIGGGRITNAGLAHLAKLPALHYLSLWGNEKSLGRRITDDGLRHIREIPALKTLVLPSIITDAGVAHLAGHPTLENLSLYNTQITNQGLPYLASLPSLRKLNLRNRDADPRNPPITDAGLAHLKRIKTLEHLDLPNFGFTDAGLADLGELTNLKYLWIGCRGNSPFTDAGMKHVAKLHALESLSINAKNLSDEGVACIASLSRLRSLLLGTDAISVEGMAQLAKLRELETLELTANKVPFSGANHLNGLPKLNRLTLRMLVNDGATLDLGRLPRLEFVTLNAATGSTFRDKDLASLGRLKQLVWLQMSGMDTPLEITDQGIGYLAGLKDLDRLTIGGPALTDRSLATIGGFKRLDMLNVWGNFTDAGLRNLEDLKALRSVTIRSGTNFSPAARERLRKNMPNLLVLTLDTDQALSAGGKAPAIDAQPQTAHPKPGTPAPDFTVTTIDGKEFTLSKQRGKVVLLYFWATWCKPCVAGLPELKKTQEGLQKKYGERLVWVNLAMDDVDSKVRDLVEAQKWPGVHARIGLNARLAAEYGVEGAPDNFLIGPDGRVLLNRESPEGPEDTERVIDRALSQSL